MISERELAKAKEQMRKLGIRVPEQKAEQAQPTAARPTQAYTLPKGAYCYAVETMSRAGLTDPVTGRTLCRFDSIKAMEEWVKGNPNRKRTDRNMFRREIERAGRIKSWMPLVKPYQGEYIA